MPVVARGQQYVFQTYRQPQGLLNLGIRGVVKDHAGFLWLATENGVYRFLGSGFERFGQQQGIAELDISDIVADQSGTVWVATGENLYRWDGNRFQVAGSTAIQVSDSQRMAVEDPRHLLVVAQQRLYRLEHDQQGKMLSYAQVFSDEMMRANPELAQVASVNVVSGAGARPQIWIGCADHLYSLPGGEDGSTGPGSVTAWGKEQGLPKDEWKGILLDHEGTLWAGGLAHVAVLSRGSSRFEDRSIPGSDTATVYRHAPLVEDRQGRVLAPSQNGLARWESGHWRTFGSVNGLPRTGEISGMAFDAGGDLWIGSHGGGLVGWTGYEDWEGWSDNQGLPSPVVWAIVSAREGHVLVGTESGFGWIDPHSGAAGALLPKERWKLGQISAMASMRDGSVIAGTFSGGLLRVDPKSGRTELTARLPDYVMDILEDRAGRVFFATKQGIYLRAAGSSPAMPLPIPEADALLGDARRVETGCASRDGALWFLSSNRLLREKDGAWSIPAIDGLSRLSGTLRALSCADDGTIWMTGDQTGTWRLTPKDGRLEAWQLRLPEELQILAPLAVLVDHRGWVWLGTDLGVVVWNGISWRHLSQESGLIWNDIDQTAMHEAPDGSLWVGTSGGIAHLLHPERVFESIPLSVSVTAIKRGRMLFPMATEITLPWSGLPLNFQFSSPAMPNRSELVFNYRLKDFQADWVENKDGLAIFSGLPPGDYILEAVAQNASLGSHSDVVQVSVHILPPWWKSQWFIGVCVLSLLGLFWATTRLYARHLRARSRHLESQVKERTRELELSREQLRIQATHDGLTGMLNRSAALRALAKELERATREGRRLVVALVDLDHFKEINDTRGHLAGDEALRWFAAAVGSAIRPYDVAGRYGGEEFILILTEIPVDAVQQRLSVLHGAISNLTVMDRGSEFTVNCSVGATLFEPETGGTVESLLIVADHALYEAKSQGRNRAVLCASNNRTDLPVQLGAHSPAGD
jgi:diguanylate cyclase (GGDEF)-like protein